MRGQKKIDWAELQKPVVLKADDWENNNYLLFKELRTAFDRIEEFTRIHSETGDDFEVPMNIGIFGERGSGKSSLLKSLKNKLEAEKYYVFDIIDPNTLSSDLNILEILITNVYQYIIHQNIEDPYLIERIISKLKRIMSALAIKRQKEDYLKKDNPSIDILDKVNDIVKLDELIIELLNEFKEILKKEKKYREFKDLVLIIDDLDLLDNKYIFKLISEIHEYLNTKIIIVFACRNRQLQDSILEEKIKSSKELLGKQIIEIEELKRQIDSMLTKLIPTENRISLFNQNDLLTEEYTKIFDSLGIDNSSRISNKLDLKNLEYGEKKQTVESWIYNQSLYLTGVYIKPVDEKETVNLFLPRSLREFVQFAEMVSKLLTSKGKVENNNINHLKNKNFSDETIKEIDRMSFLSANIEYFRKYYVDKSGHELSKELRNLIDTWEFVDSHQKNYLTFHYFLNKVNFANNYKVSVSEGDSLKNNYPFNLSVVENYNLCLGDIFKIMEFYKIYVAKTPSDFFEVYTVKILYSLELVRLLSEAFYQMLKDRYSFNENENEFFQHQSFDEVEFLATNLSARKYLDLINTSFMPGDFNYLDYITDRKDGDYTIINKEDIVTQDFANNFINSFVSSSGDIRKVIMSNKSSFMYRALYSYLPFRNEKALEANRKYNIDYFILFGKAFYLKNAMEQYVEYYRGKKEKVYFLLSSMFQIDNFVRVNYSRRSEENKHTYVIKIIGRIIKTINNENENGAIENIIPFYFRSIFPMDKQEYNIPYIKDTIDNVASENIKLIDQEYDSIFNKIILSKIKQEIRVSFAEGTWVDLSFANKEQIREAIDIIKEHESNVSKDVMDLCKKLKNQYLDKPKTKITSKKIQETINKLSEILVKNYQTEELKKEYDRE